VDVGANVLAGADPDRIVECARAMSQKPRDWPNPFGDGKSGERIVDILLAR
jgi:UDP-N-acetylglucosamine 2-epimerase (non-hydrolysing)